MDFNIIEIAFMIFSNLLSVGLSSYVTVQKMKIHIEYLREGVVNAHKRIDTIPHP